MRVTSTISNGLGILVLSLACSLFVSGDSSAQNGHVLVDHWEGLNSRGELEVGKTLKAWIRLDNNTGIKRAPANYFKYFSTDGAEWTTVLGDTLPTLTKSANFDLGYSIAYRSRDGAGVDSICFGGAFIGGGGIPNGFDTLAWTIAAGPIEIGSEGKTICLDSSAWVTAPWTWGGVGVPSVSPEWSGQECFQITEANCRCVGIRGNVNGDAAEQVDISDLIDLVDYLFISNDPSVLCWNEANVDVNSQLDIADLINLNGLLFGGLEPFPPCE